MNPRKRRLRRLHAAIRTISADRLDTIAYRLENTGKLPAYATPLERVAFTTYPRLMRHRAGR